MPYFSYCSPVWDNIGKRLLEKLQKLQNRTARIVTLHNYDDRSRDLLDELAWKRLEHNLTFT